MRPVLAVSSASLTLGEVHEQIADKFQLSEEERNERLPSGKQTVINNRVGWARTYLNKAGLLSIPVKGLVPITERDHELDELLVRAASPSFFEQLVVDLMIAMGYGGSRKEAGKAV